MKKLVAICLAVVFTLNFVGCHSSEKSQSANSGTASVGIDFSKCESAEDYIDIAKDYLEEGDVYLANEAVRAGYIKTGDATLKLLPLSGKPTVESALIHHRLGLSTTAFPSASCMQYFLGKELVIARASVPKISCPMFIYTFHPQTHRIQAIEVSSFLSYDKLDTDLFNIAFPIRVPSNPVLLNFEDAMEEAKRREIAPLNFTYRFEYTEDGALCGVKCGETEGIVTKTATGYKIIMSEDPLQANSPGSSVLEFDLQNGKIVRMADELYNKSEAFSYQDNGSCTVTGSMKDDKENIHNATVIYNKDNLAETSTLDDENETYTYNDRQMPVQLIHTEKNDSKEYHFSYNNAGSLMTQTDGNNTYTYLYDDEGRLVKITRDAETYTINYDDKNRLTEFDGLSEFTYENSDGTISSFYYNYLEKRYNIVRDADGFVLGLSYPDAKIVKVQDSPLCPDFISAIDENHIYKVSVSDEELYFYVQAREKQDYDDLFTLAKANGYIEIPLDNRLDYDDLSANVRWITNDWDSPTVLIKAHKESDLLYCMRVCKISKEEISQGWQEYVSHSEQYI